MAKEKVELESTIGLRPKLLMLTMKVMMQLHRSTCVEGGPGLGKTSMWKEAADELGYQWVLKHLPTMQPEDFGLPVPNAEKTEIKFIVPDWFPTDAKVKAGRFAALGVLLMDDRNQADAAHQKILANIVQERELHGEKLAKGWCVMSTGNRQQDRAGANKVLTHLRNRETVLWFIADLNEWCDWAYKNGVRPEVISFIRFKPNLLFHFDPNADANPTPRSWVEGVSAILDKLPVEAENACIAGAVGEGAAVEFIAFLRTYRSLPNPDEVIKHPKTADIPDNPATKYALCGALAYRATKQNFGAIIEYAARLDPEYTVITVVDACRRDESLGTTTEFTKWATKYQHILTKG